MCNLKDVHSGRVVTRGWAPSALSSKKMHLPLASPFPHRPQSRFKTGWRGRPRSCARYLKSARVLVDRWGVAGLRLATHSGSEAVFVGTVF